MNANFKRREFLNTCCKAGIACCGLMLSSGLDAGNIIQDEKPDPGKLNYCGYQCPPDCKMKKATVENNLELKKQAYVDWRIEKKYGMAFDAEIVFCWGCKTQDKPLGVITKNCSVRSCAISRKYDSCIQCRELSGCDKEIWTTFPQFKQLMIELQKKFFAS